MIKNRAVIAYSPYYQGIMTWLEGRGCYSSDEKEFESFQSARVQMQYHKEHLERNGWRVVIGSPGLLDTWPESALHIELRDANLLQMFEE